MSGSPIEPPFDCEWDRAAEAWLTAQHTASWYIGDATEAEWRHAYDATREAASG